jgi:hypothetical protein
MLVSVPKIAAVRLELLRREVNAGRRFSHGFLNLRTSIMFYLCMASQWLTILQVGSTLVYSQDLLGAGSSMTVLGVTL